MKTFTCRLDGAYQVHGARDMARLEQRQRRVLAKKRRQPFKAERRLMAYVNHGRWLVDCLCGAGNAVDTETATARCFGCGAIHERIELPDNAPEIEALLIPRPMRHRNWVPGEQIEALRAENVLHGVS